MRLRRGGFARPCAALRAAHNNEGAPDYIAQAI